MATNPINDPVRQLTPMMSQLVRQNQAFAGHVDRLVTGLGDPSKDMRAGFRAVDAKIDASRAEMDIRFDALRTEMNDRFRAVGTRFDEVDERLSRLEDGMRELHSDMLRLHNGVLNAQQSALEAHLRLDDDQGGQDPSP
jgi:hypothetical protein